MKTKVLSIREYVHQLDCNGTNKNDWFFALWWGVAAVWFFYGLKKLLFNQIK